MAKVNFQFTIYSKTATHFTTCLRHGPKDAKDDNKEVLSSIKYSMLASLPIDFLSRSQVEYLNNGLSSPISASSPSVYFSWISSAGMRALCLLIRLRMKKYTIGQTIPNSPSMVMLIPKPTGYVGLSDPM